MISFYKVIISMNEEKIIKVEDDREDVDNSVTENDSGNITSPFSTKDIKVSNVIIGLSNIITRLEYDEIDLNPDFQRNASLWDKKKMSRLIESILLRLPLPVFYFDVSDPDKWIVVDGLQRLSALKEFIVDKSFRLRDLEFLKDLKGKNYEELDKNLKRVINETQIITYQIEAQTPKEVRYSIFNRINTGGLTLNAQEIRQAINQRGKGIKFLKDVAADLTFKKIVGVSSARMLDRELILRFVAFKLLPLTSKNEFKYLDMGTFLDSAMEELDQIKDDQKLTELKNSLIESLIFSEKVFGEAHRFSRSIALNDNTNTLNRSLYDVISVCFSEVNDKDRFITNKQSFLDEFNRLLLQQDGEFSLSITAGTSSKGAVEVRFKIMKDLINKVVDCE